MIDNQFAFPRRYAAVHAPEAISLQNLKAKPFRDRLSDWIWPWRARIKTAAIKKKIRIC